MEEKVTLKITLTKEEYEALKALARGEGYLQVSDYAALLLRRAMARREAGQQIDARELSEAISKRLERTIVDLINPFTGKIDEISRRISELVDAIESKEEARAPQERAPERRAQQPSAMGKLKEQGVVFKEEVSWMKSPERFFEKLKREGAIVVERGDEKIAIDPELWGRFMEEVSKMTAKDVEDAAELVNSYLGERAAKLFKKLVRLGIVVYDEDEQSWIIQSIGPASG